MRVSARLVEARAVDVDLGEVVSLQELRVTASAVSFEIRPAGAIAISEAEATIVLTEATLNRLLRRYPAEGTRDLELKTFVGKVKIEGKWLVAGVPVPFDLTGVPEIEGGARLCITVQQVRVLGPVVLPGLAVQGIANKLNDALARAFDVTRLPIPMRLTSIKVEPGRVVVGGTGSVELRSPAPLPVSAEPVPAHIEPPAG